MGSVVARAERMLAVLARRDFDSFVEYVGRDGHGEPILQRALDRLVWEFVERTHADGASAGVMLPMGFGKTTQCCYRAAWEIGRDPNRLVSIVTDSIDNAKERVELVRRILDLREYRLVFPHVRVVPGKDERARFTIERDGLSKDPTCSAEGVLTGTGTRTNFLLLDDIVTQRNALLEPTNRKRVLEAVRLTWASRANFGERVTVPIVWIQTAYHQSDAASILREDADSGWRWLVVRAEAPFEELAWERWQFGDVVATCHIESPFGADEVAERARRMGPTAAARGLANRPVSGEECPFCEQHFQAPTPLRPEAYAARVLFADPAGDATRIRRGDPDWCAVVAIGRHPEGHWEVYGADRMRGSPSAQAAFIASRVQRWRPHRVFQEAVKDEALVGVVQAALKDRDAWVPVTPIKPSTNKEIRIVQALEPALAADPPLLRVCGRAFPELRNEALAFPAAAHDDLLDALAGAFAQASTGGPMRHHSSVKRKSAASTAGARSERPWLVSRPRRPRIWERTRGGGRVPRLWN